MRNPRNNFFARIGRALFRRNLYYVFRPIRRLFNRMRYGIYRFLPYPIRRFFPFLERQGISVLRQKVREKLKGKKEQEQALLAPCFEEEVSEEIRLARLARIPQVNSGYVNYECVNQETLGCPFALQTIQENPHAKYCQKCNFPAVLATDSEIIGRKGRYQVISYLGRRGRGRIYRGINVNNEEIVAIKEYLLPKLHFNDQEMRQGRKVFENQGELGLSDGRRQDFRLPISAEAIGDRHDLERCYLITNGNTNNLPSLRLYLGKYGAMSPTLVKDVLNQILQILESLHFQKYRFTTGKIYSNLAHGNLNLDTVLISFDRRPFFVKTPVNIYLSDLALWEDLFIPPPTTPNIIDLQQDLVAVGQIAFYLLAGMTMDENDKLLNPRKQSQWQTDDLALKDYIERLLRYKTPFADVFSARQALLRLPMAPLTPTSSEKKFQTKKKKKTPWWVWAIVTALIILLLSQLVAWLTNRRQQVVRQVAEPTICCVSQITAIPRGSFNYTSPRKGSWDYVLTQKNLLVKNETLQQFLRKKMPRFFQVDYKSHNETDKDILPQIINRDINFAITSEESLTNVDTELLYTTRDLALETIAYDGIAIFVAFGYNVGEQRLLASLNGQLSMEQLRQLYTGQITNWQELGGADLPVKLYIPDNPEVVDIFETKVLQDPLDIDVFRSLLTTNSQDNSDEITQEDELNNPNNPKINRLPVYLMLRSILREFEDDQVASIGFAPISKIFGQCAVYPLAVSSNGENGIQPFIQDNGQAIDINLDLCKAKGNYQPNSVVFQQQTYPLTYPLKVIYPLDNNLPPAGQKFAEILKTQEIQTAMAKTGLIPLIEDEQLTNKSN